MSSRSRANTTIKVGVDTRKFQKGQLVFGNSAGAYTFDNTFTKANGSVTANPIGLDLAALELGLPTTASADLNAHYVGNQSYLALFAQDDWRVNAGAGPEHGCFATIMTSRRTSATVTR